MKSDGKFLAVLVVLGLFLAFSAGAPVMAQQTFYSGDHVGNVAPTTKAKPINEALRTGIQGGDLVGDLGPAQGDLLCNMNPKDSASCYASMPCGPKGQQCALNHNHKGRCSS